MSDENKNSANDRSEPIHPSTSLIPTIPENKQPTSSAETQQLSAGSTGFEIPKSRETVRIERFAGYRLIKELGSGGMGVVFEAEDEKLKRVVALKILRGDLGDQLAAKRRFQREAEATAAVKNPHIVTIYQVGEENDLPFIAMERLFGETLEERLNRVKKLPLAEAVEIGRQIAVGLDAAHCAGLIHRDVKPSNIWLEAGTNQVKILGFGLAFATGSEHLTGSGFIIGTPNYMSPEQARGEELDFRSDLFSLGTILYYAVTGDKPFDAPTAVSIMTSLENRTPVRLTARDQSITAPFSNLVSELMSKSIEHRPKSAKEVADRLGRREMLIPNYLPTVPEEPSVTSQPTLPPTRPKFVANSRKEPTTSMFSGLLMVIATAFVVVVCYLYFWVWNKGQLVIESNYANTEIEVWSGSQLLGVATNEKPLILQSGTYDLQLRKPLTGYYLAPNQVIIERDGEVVAKLIKKN